jgi:polysaccharide chain length determinant protein (PEP-CTERM system associated)
VDYWFRFVAQKVAMAWRWRWILVVTAWGVCLAGWLAVASLPDSYESEARLYVDADAVLTPLLHGLAVDTATASQLEVMQKTLLSRPNLEKLVGMTDLGLQAAVPSERDLLLRRLASGIKVQAQDRNIFTISYRSSNPILTHDVVAALLAIFMEEATRTNRSGMNNAQQFLDRQIASYETQLRTAEQRRADFRRKYLEILPIDRNGSFSRLDGARIEVQNVEAQLRDATARLAALQAHVQLTPPTLPGPVAGSAQGSELATAERHLAELRAKFTDEHPDVIIARRLVASGRSAASPAPVAAARATRNPLYDQLRLQVIDAQSLVSSLNARLETAKGDRDRLEAMARAAPGVEAEYQNLDRDYNVIRKNYEELLSRREASNITRAADTTADKIQLRIIDPPRIPVLPVSPNRLLLISVVLAGGIGAAIALAILISELDRSVGDVGQLRSFGLPVLGGISAVPQRRSAAFYPQTAALAAAALLLFAVYGALSAELILHHGLMQ